VLHITRQHGTTPEDAIRTFFVGATEPWDESHLRFETHGDARPLLDPPRARPLDHRHQLLQARRGVMAGLNDRPADKPGESIDMKIVADRVDEDPEVSALVTRLEAAADRELAAGTVTLRWGRQQIAVVKRAAALIGVPYQTYLKQVVFRQAVIDIERAEATLSRR
jgi:predicted DNA binding CopG/RHH family protein